MTPLKILYYLLQDGRKLRSRAITHLPRDTGECTPRLGRLRAEQKLKWNCGRKEIRSSGKERKLMAGKCKRKQTEKENSIESSRRSDSSNTQQLPDSDQELQMQQRDELETMSSNSDQNNAEPAIYFKRYLGPTRMRYIQMGTASKVHNNDQWNLEETVRQLERKCSLDLLTIAHETTYDEKLLKSLVCLERRKLEQIPDEYKVYKTNLSTRFGVVFYADKIVLPTPLKQTTNMLLNEEHPAINKMNHAARPIWWPKLVNDTQAKCNKCIPCKMSGKCIKPQFSMTVINYLSPVEKPNQEIQLDLIGPIRYKHRKFYILFDRPVQQMTGSLHLRGTQ